MKTIFISGVAGFIGSHFARTCLRRGLTVWGADDFSVGSPERIVDLEKEPEFQFFEHDLAGSVLAMGERMDYVAHFLSHAEIFSLQEDAESVFLNDIMGLRHVLEMARDWRAVFLLASSSDVYGPNLSSPLQEDKLGELNPLCLPYGVLASLKRFLETWVVSAHRRDGLEIRIARLFEVYGEGMSCKGGGWLASMCRDALQQKRLKIWGHKKNRYSLIHVKDVVEALYRLLYVNYTQPLNVGSPEAFDPETIAQAFFERQKNPANSLQRIRQPLGFPMSRIPDLTNIERALSWEAKLPFLQGLKDVSLTHAKNLKTS